MAKSYLFFDNASTTRCCAKAVELICRFATEDFGNPSSSHAMGQDAAKAIRDARVFFSNAFKVGPDQIIFTGSGSESDNLAIYGVAMHALASKKENPRVIVSAIEHPAVKATAKSLSALGIDVQYAPVDSRGQINQAMFLELVTPETVLVSIHQVNNIVGAILPVEELARLAKLKAPELVFHTDAVQAFGKVRLPSFPSPVDLISVSAHKIEGPKGVGALIVLNKNLLKAGLRPLVWGGGQESGFRAGTQNAGLIAGFHAAAEEALGTQTKFIQHCESLRARLRELLSARDLLGSTVTWNSPADASPNIVNLSVPNFPSGPLAKLLEERGVLVSTGSACSSQKMEPDAVLSAMGLPAQVHSSAIRISFSQDNSLDDVSSLVGALEESIKLMSMLLGPKRKKSS